MRAQELYNSYCRKQITEADFLYHMRRDQMLKEFISPVNNTQDIISILKNRGQITQQVTEDQLIKEAPGEDEHGETLPNDPEFGEELEEGSEDEERYDEIDEKFGTDEVRDILKNNDQLGFDHIGEAMNAILLDKNFDYADVSPEDVNKLKSWRTDTIRKAKGKPPITEVKKPKLTADQVNYYEFTKGWRLELETTDDIDKAKDKALKNLDTDPAYYTNKIDQDTKAKMVVNKKDNKEKILKAPTDQIEVKDRENQMKNAKKKDPVKSNVKTNLGNQEKAKGMPKGVKVMKLKEGIKNIIKEDAGYNQHLEAIRGMTKMDPKDLAKQILGGQLPMSGLRAEFAGKVLGKAIQDGNKDTDVVNAFHKLSDKKLNESTDFESWKKSVIGDLQTSVKSDEKVAEKIFSHYMKDFQSSHSSGKDPKTAVKDFLKNVKKPKKEEFEGNVGPQEADWVDTTLESKKLNESEDRKKIYQKAFASIDKAIKSGNEYLSNKKKRQ